MRLGVTVQGVSDWGYICPWGKCPGGTCQGVGGGGLSCHYIGFETVLRLGAGNLNSS